MASGASFSSTNNPITIQNSQDPLFTINLFNMTKLLSTNYLIWSLQIQSLLKGYDLHHFIDGVHTPPSFVGIISSLALSLVLSTFHYNRLLPAPPLLLMHDKPYGVLRAQNQLVNICDYKTHVDEVALLRKLVDDEDLIDRVLKGLSDKYKSVIDAINAVTRQFILLSCMRNFSTNKHLFKYVHQPPLHNNQALPLRFLLMINHAVFNDTLSNDARCFDFNNTTPTWLLDSKVSYHVMSDLNNLSLHSSYQGSDDIMIGDRSALPITHISSTTIPTFSHTFTLQNVKNLNTGAILLMGEPKDGIYEWLTTFPSVTSSPLLAFSSVKTTSSEWHSRLGHPSFVIMKNIVSKFSLPLYSLLSSSTHCNACSCNKSHKIPFSSSTLTSSHPPELLFSDV
ncbi:hypothetical protein AAG906_033574 [Vitis piasezkii]